MNIEKSQLERLKELAKKNEWKLPKDEKISQWLAKRAKVQGNLAEIKPMSIEELFGKFGNPIAHCTCNCGCTGD